MSTVFSKNKEKRSRSSSNEANNSFVKNVTSRVSGLLPATITKWFSSPSSSNANGSTPAADATDSSTEDEAPESPITTQPPSKRMKFSSPGIYNRFGASDANCVTSNIETLEQCTTYSTVQSPPGRTTFRRETNYVSTPIRAPTEESTIDRSDRDSTMFKSQHSISSVGTSVATKRKSLFDSPTNEASVKAYAKTASNTVVDPKAPCFKPSLLGSPFYPGRTSYGGASSLYINQPNIKQRKVALVNESNSSDNTTMSHSARRVMDLLENYSSPLVEAKRIAPYINMRHESRNNTTISGSPNQQKVVSYKTQELHVPSNASILRLKQRLRLMDSTNAARQIIASHSSTAEFVPYPSTNTQKEHSEKDTSSKLTTKVKSRLTRPKRGENIELIEQPAEPVNLPTAVLQIDQDNLPKFTFGSTVSQPTTDPTPKLTITSTPKLIVSKSETVTKPVDTFISKPSLSKPETVASNDTYKFSSPVRISSDSLLISPTLPDFKFGSPERGIDNPIVVDEKEDDKLFCFVGTPKETEKVSTPKTKDWQCPDCWVSNKTDASKCVCCEAIRPSNDPVAPSKESVSKALENSINKLPPTKLTDSSKWKCEDCWVSNDDNVNKCVCCGANNPKSVFVAKKSSERVIPATVTSMSSSANATSADSEWKCGDCWIVNISSEYKCAACGGLRPGAKQDTNPPVSKNTIGSSFSKTTNNSLDKFVKALNDKWECLSCLVRNESNRSKCVCCESDKPGLVKESDKNTFNFGVNANTSFKFGIDQNTSDTNPYKMADSKPFEIGMKPEESETNNNILPKTPSFMFGIPSKKPEDQIDTAKENKISEAPKMNFSFGIPKKPTESLATSIFGSAVKNISESTPKKDVEEKEKLQEVPSVTFTLPAPKETSKPLTGIFGSELTSPVSKPPAPTPTLLNPISNTEGKETTLDEPLTILPNSTNTEVAKPQSSFTFTASGIKPAVNLFAVPSATTSSFAAPVQAPAPTTTTVSLFQKPETTSTATLMLFPKPGINTTSTVTMFQKPGINTTSTVTMFQKPGITTTTPTATLFQKPAITTTSTVMMFQKPDITTTSTVTMFQNTKTITTAAPPSLAATGPIFNFGTNTNPITQSTNAQPEKPKFNFTFGSSTAMFNNTFGASNDNNASANKIGITGNAFGSGGNGLSAPNTLGSSNSITPAKIGGSNELPKNQLMGGNELEKQGMFGAPVQKENLWSSPSGNTSNMFVSNASSNSMQKAAAFTFGSGTPFNTSNTTPATPFNAGTTLATPFSANTASPTSPFNSSNAPTPAPFSASSTTPATPFGSNTAAAPNIFGMNQNQPAQPMFSSPVQNQPAPSLFGTPQPASNPAALFGSPNVNATPTFGTSSPSMPSFEAPTPQPAFNFGAPQPTGIFGFGQQQSQQPQQPGLYNFGASAGGASHMQFNMGSAPNTSVRRVRKAVRRNPQR